MFAESKLAIPIVIRGLVFRNNRELVLAFNLNFEFWTLDSSVFVKYSNTLICQALYIILNEENVILTTELCHNIWDCNVIYWNDTFINMHSTFSKWPTTRPISQKRHTYGQDPGMEHHKCKLFFLTISHLYVGSFCLSYSYENRPQNTTFVNVICQEL